MLREFSHRRIGVLFAIDWLGTLAIFLCAALIRAQVGSLPPWAASLLGFFRITADEAWDPNVAPGDIYPVQVLVLIAAIWPIVLVGSSVYDGRQNETLKAELLNLLVAASVSTLVLAGSLYFTGWETARGLFLVFFALDIALLFSVRFLLYGYRWTTDPLLVSGRRAVLVVGAGEVGRNVASQLRRYARQDLQVVGYLDDDADKQDKSIDRKPVLGTTREIESVVAAHSVAEVVIALPLRAHQQLVEMCGKLQAIGVRVYVVPDLFALSFPNATLDGFGGIPVIYLGQPGAVLWHRLIKRAFDTVVATISVLLVAGLVKWTSPGPVFYRQQRIGEGGRAFVMYKFRTMLQDNDPGIHVEHVSRLIKENLDPTEHGTKTLKLKSDPRVTRLGKILRKTSLDELPQLFNVLGGEMSLVGPRPSLAYEVSLFKDWHKHRFETLPGITGLWQVKGRNRVSFDEMVRMDVEYIQKQSVWLDIKILVQTPFAMLFGRGGG